MAPPAHSNASEFDHLPSPWETYPAVPLRPIGVMVISALIALIGVVAILAAVFYLVSDLAGGTSSAALPYPLAFTNVFAGPFGALLGIAFGGIFLGVATSLWRQEVWALWTVTVLAFGGVLYLVFTASFDVLLLVLAAMIVYLLSVRQYFY